MAHHTSSNPNEFILPDLGEGVAEAELIKWRVTVGQTVKEHDILADMETDKALVEVPSPRAGTIASLFSSRTGLPANSRCSCSSDSITAPLRIRTLPSWSMTGQGRDTPMDKSLSVTEMRLMAG